MIIDPSDVSGRATQLRETLQALGPTFVKAGQVWSLAKYDWLILRHQVLANRPDIVRGDYMDELTKLQDDVPAAIETIKSAG